MFRILLITLGILLFGAPFAVGTAETPSFFHEAAGFAVLFVAVGGLILSERLLAGIGPKGGGAESGAPAPQAVVPATDAIVPAGGDTATPLNLAKRLALLRRHLDLPGLRILDAGCGDGGIRRGPAPVRRRRRGDRA